MGSSVGVSKVKSASDFRQALDAAFRYDTKIIIEEYIPGREIEVAVLGNLTPEASIPGELIPSHEFYSYEAKYIDPDGAKAMIPADLSDATTQAVRRLACEVFAALCCRGLARVDFFVTKDERIYVNEINTFPGFTSISMFPKLWEASGMPLGPLLDRLIGLALEQAQAEARLQVA
jgi:D-alanine-D-alanine ligase